MSENEKFTAEVAETVAETVTEQDIKLATPQESNPLENESVGISEKETEKSEIAEEVEKETTDTENNQNEVHSKKKIGAVIAACAVLALSLSAVGMFGLSNRGAQATVDTTDTTASLSKTDVPVITDKVTGENSAVVGTISWWKAGVEEYDFINIDEDMMATTTTTTTTVTTTPAPETTTTAETTTVTTTTPPPTTTTVTTTEKKPEYVEEEIEKVTFYLTTNVNLRKGPGTSFDKITTLKKDTAVTAVAKVSNGWYKVKFGDMTGYIIDDYLTKTKPVVTTTTTTTTTTTKPADTVAPDTEGETTIGTEPVISYTDEELEMFYYVVEGEVGGCSEESKLAVANVIINRVKSPRFANTLKGVMTAKNQFTAINNYYSKKRTPTASTIDCVNRALYGEDNSNGAVYFYSAKYCSASTIAWFESLTFCLEIDGQRYFK